MNTNKINFFHNNIVANRVKSANISAIKKMMALAFEETRKGKEIVSLSVGIPFYKMPKYLKEQTLKALAEKADIDKYTFFAGMDKLRDLIASKIRDQMQIKTTREEILITPGSMGALMYTMTTILNKGDEVILFSPYFSSHAEQIKLAEGIPVEVPLIEPNKKDGFYRIDFDLLNKKINKKTKAILVCSPANPTGAVLLKQDLLKLAEIIKKNNLYLINDEVYDFLIYDNKEYFNISTIKDLWPKVIRCWSFSKKYGMTGWRLGYLHTNHKLIQHILKVHDSTIVCASHVAQEAGYIALSSDKELEEELLRNKKQFEKNRQLICQRLDRLSDLFSYIKPQGAYYIFPKYHLKMKSINFAKKLLYEAGVAVVPGIGFGKAGEYHIRISFGGYFEDINKAFDKIEKWWRVYKNKF